MNSFFTDSHAHLDFDKYDSDRDETIQRARTANVRNIIQIALGPSEERYSKCLSIAEQNENMWMTVGLHPHEADHYTPQVHALIRSYAKKTKVVAIGEIGLDYYYEHSDRENQKRCFSELMDLAIEMNLPICIHTRDAFDDTVSLTKEKKIFQKVGGVIHCFTGTKIQAEKFLEMGAYISFSGVVTFKNTTELQEAAKIVPLDRMLIETDCPFLAPIPHRGKRNEPSYIVEVAKTIAALKGCSVEDIATATSANAQKLFRF